MLNANRYLLHCNESLRNQKAFNKLTPSLTELKAKQKQSSQMQNTSLTPVGHATPYVPTRLKIVKTLIRLAAALKHRVYAKKSANIIACCLYSEILVELPANYFLALKYVLRRAVKRHQMRLHTLKLNFSNIPVRLQALSMRSAPAKKHPQKHQVLKPVAWLSKVKTQLQGIAKKLQLQPKSPEIQEQELKELSALKKKAYFRQLAFLKAQGPVKYGQLLKKEKPKKKAISGIALGLALKRAKQFRKIPIKIRVLWLLKFKAHQLNFLITNQFKSLDEQKALAA